MGNITNEVREFGSEVAEDISQPITSALTTVGDTITGAWDTVSKGFLTGLENVEVGIFDFRTGAVKGLDRGLNWLTDQSARFIPRVWMTIIPPFFDGIYQVIVFTVPELLSIPANILVFLGVFFMTVVGFKFIKEATLERIEKEAQKIDLDDTLIGPDLDLDEAKKVFETLIPRL